MKDPYQEAVAAQLKERETPAALMKAMREGTHIPALSNEQLASSTSLTSQEAKKLWDNELKDERYALQALFLTEMWPTYEALLEKDWDAYYMQARTLEGVTDDIVKLQYATGVPFYEAMTDWNERCERQRGKETKPLNHAYERLLAVQAFGKSHSLLEETAQPATLIEKGFGTAALGTWGLIELVPRMARGKGLTEDQMVGAIESAYGPLIAIYMNINEEVSDKILMEMTVAPDDTYSATTFSEKFFILEQNHEGKWVLKLNHEAMMGIVGPDGVPLITKLPLSRTEGCPAAYARKDGTNVMQRYFDYSIGVARKLYFPKLSTP